MTAYTTLKMIFSICILTSIYEKTFFILFRKLKIKYLPKKLCKNWMQYSSNWVVIPRSNKKVLSMLVRELIKRPSYIVANGSKSVAQMTTSAKKMWEAFLSRVLIQKCCCINCLHLFWYKIYLFTFKWPDVCGTIVFFL